MLQKLSFIRKKELHHPRKNRNAKLDRLKGVLPYGESKKIVWVVISIFWVVIVYKKTYSAMNPKIIHNSYE